MQVVFFFYHIYRMHKKIANILLFPIITFIKIIITYWIYMAQFEEALAFEKAGLNASPKALFASPW